VSSEGHEELTALNELRQSAGWRLFLAHLDQEHGPAGYGRRMQRALSEIQPGPERAYEVARVAEQVDATARAVNELVKWPEERIRLLTPEPASRRPFAALRRTPA
jgi:hypothetical protein